MERLRAAVQAGGDDDVAAIVDAVHAELIALPDPDVIRLANRVFGHPNSVEAVDAAWSNLVNELGRFAEWVPDKLRMQRIVTATHSLYKFLHANISIKNE